MLARNRLRCHFIRHSEFVVKQQKLSFHDSSIPPLITYLVIEPKLRARKQRPDELTNRSVAVFGMCGEEFRAGDQLIVVRLPAKGCLESRSDNDLLVVLRQQLPQDTTGACGDYLLQRWVVR